MSDKLVIESKEHHQELSGIGATEQQVDAKDTVPQRIDKKGTKVEDLAGTGEHGFQRRDSFHGLGRSSSSRTRASKVSGVKGFSRKCGCCAKPGSLFKLVSREWETSRGADPAF